MTNSRWIGSPATVVAVAGFVIGAVAAWLVSQGNPGNMGLCIACFTRDIAGSFGGAAFKMEGVAYIRPEILGLVFGALASALASREFRPRKGSSVILRFALGFIFMTASLIFLGCTVRAWLRLGGGDLNALYGIAGIVAGVAIGVAFLRRGFNLGRAKHRSAAWGWVGPVLMAVLLVLALLAAFGAKPGFLTQTPANAALADRPLAGGLRAPLFVSLFAAFGLGVLAQKSRFCTTGGIRDAILLKRFDMLLGVLGLFAGAAAGNLLLGQFKLGFTGQPIAHTDALGNFAAMTVAGLAAIMLGGCPFRQVIMVGEGDFGATVVLLGMFAGALFAHRMVVASSAAGLTEMAWPVLAVMFAVLVGIALFKCERPA